MITDMKAYQKEYRKKHKEELKSYKKNYYQKHKKEILSRQKAYKESHRENKRNYDKVYNKKDVNSNGKPKAYIRIQSNHYLNKHCTKIPGYEIHHCFTYDDPKKFIYCPHEKHLEIHQYLRDNKIKADTNHYEQIKHLLDDTVIVYGV